MPQHFSWPLFFLVNMDGVVQKGTSALKFLWQDRDPRVRVVESEVTATVLNSCQHRGIPTILQCPQEVCAMVGHSQGSDHDPECMAILHLPYTLHLADIVTVEGRVRGYNHRKLFAQKYEERQRVSSKRINNNRAHCTSNVCFEVILRGSWIVDWRVRLTFTVFRGHFEMVACRRLTSAIAIQKLSEVIRRGLRIVVWRA
jgi:hypothetical protein